ncbi:hypothetical protein AgCh_012839 [Apium graveolens]
MATASVAAGRGGSVTYDGRSLIINGKRSILFSGSIHYPRSTPDMWPSLISKAKGGGLQVIQTYVFWNLHEPQPGLLRMQNFTAKIVNMMKSEGLYASQGGPIILSQIENEYQTVEAAFHEQGATYVRWAAQMAVGLQTGVPWVMCKQDDAPDPVSLQLTDADIQDFSLSDLQINACNGLRCGETFAGPNSPNKPSLWTENWTSNEPIPQYDETSIKANILLEQTNATKDVSDYLWYTFSFQRNSSNSKSTLSVPSLGHALHAYVNGVFVGSAHGSRTRTPSLLTQIQLNTGINKISLLSVMVGLKVGLLGEKLQVYTSQGWSKVKWNKYNSSKQLTWYKTTFDAPGGSEPVTLNLGSMGKGEAWINAQSIGRYWVSFHTPAGKPSQSSYHVPRSFLKPTGNLLVLLDEEYGNPLGITLDTVSVTKVCSHVSDSSHPITSLKGGKKVAEKHEEAKAHLRCPSNKIISRISFASFGTPSGNCEKYSAGSCHSSNSKAIVERACVGKGECMVALSYTKFQGDPCPGIPKDLLIEAQCHSHEELSFNFRGREPSNLLL